MTPIERIAISIRQLPFQKLNLGYRVVNMVQPENLMDEQEGYRKNLAGFDTMHGRVGDWQPGWMVIATDELGAPIFVEADKEALPVYTASHEEDGWKIYYIASSLEQYLKSMQMLYKVSEGRETPEDLSANHIPEVVSEAILMDIEKKSPDIDLWYWELFLENYNLDPEGE